jgi:hypothetical protein
MYGGSVIALINAMEELQISTELEQLRVNRSFSNSVGNNSAAFWNTALFVGAGFRNGNATMGVRFNVLHKDRENIYTDAFMPFVRLFF